MRMPRIVFSVLFAMLVTLSAAAQSPDGGAAIRAVLDKQTADWNRGDIDAFATGYKNSPDILFIGTTVRRGYQGMIASYRKNYPSKAAMGVLSYLNLEVHPLDSRFATVIGNFHLERTAAGGGNADGIYSLVMEKTAAGWKIVLDHSSSIPPKTLTPAK